MKPGFIIVWLLLLFGEIVMPFHFRSLVKRSIIKSFGIECPWMPITHLS